MNNKTNLQAIALCRVSTKKQSIEGSSIEVQDERAHETADRLGVELVKVWESRGVSSKEGKNLARKDLREMLEYARAHKKVKFVIVDIADRFMRGGAKEHYYWSGRFHFEAGAELVYAQKLHLHEQAGTPMADFEEFMDVMQAKMTNTERMMKTISGMQFSAAQGRYPLRPKVGYKTSETRGLHVPDEPRWSLLRNGFLQVLDGVDVKTAVANINAAGYKTKSGRALDLSHFKDMLLCPFYAGILEVSDWPVNPKGLHKAMITPDQHEQIKRIVRGVQPRERKQFNPEFRLSKIMACTECLEEDVKHPLLTGCVQHNGKPLEKRKYYSRYRCRGCGANILQSDLHQQVSDDLLSIKLADSKIDDFLSALRKVWQQEQSLSLSQLQSLQRRLESLTEEKKSIALRQVRGNLSEERADIAIGAIDDEIQAIHEQIEVASTIEKDFVEFVEFAVNTVENLRERFWELDAEHVGWCKQLLFPDGFSVSRDKKVYTPKLSDFYRLINTKEDPEESSIFNMVISPGIEPGLPG